MTVRILSIDGGGIRGILPAKVLCEIEQHTGKSISSLFDIISGTSTGGILACGACTKVPAANLLDLYVKQGGAIFSHSTILQNIEGHVGLAAKYDPKPLEGALRGVLGANTWLSEIYSNHLIVPAYCLQMPRPELIGGVEVSSDAFMFRSWLANGSGLTPNDDRRVYDFPLWQVARATSAAPTYFPPAVVHNQHGELFYMIDGGMFANNPTALALAAARKLYPNDGRYLILSLGTGSALGKIDGSGAVSWGALQWLRQVINILMSGASQAVDHELELELGPEYVRIQAAIAGDDAPDTAMDNASADNIARLCAFGDQLVHDHLDILHGFCALLEASA